MGSGEFDWRITQISMMFPMSPFDSWLLSEMPIFEQALPEGGGGDQMPGDEDSHFGGEEGEGSFFIDSDKWIQDNSGILYDKPGFEQEIAKLEAELGLQGKRERQTNTEDWLETSEDLTHMLRTGVNGAKWGATFLGWAYASGKTLAVAGGAAGIAGGALLAAQKRVSAETLGIFAKRAGWVGIVLILVEGGFGVADRMKSGQKFWVATVDEVKETTFYDVWKDDVLDRSTFQSAERYDAMWDTFQDPDRRDH